MRADFLSCWDLQAQLEEVQLRRSAVFHAGLWDRLFSLSDLMVFQHTPQGMFSVLIFSEGSLSRLIILYCLSLQLRFASEKLL